MSSRPLGGILALALTVAVPAAARAGAPAEARCLDVVARYGLQIVATASKNALACARPIDGNHLGVNDAEICLTSGLDFRLATTLRRLAAADARWCRRDPAQRPAAGYAGAAALADAARFAGTEIVTIVLGPVLNMLAAPGSDEARCQKAVAAGAARLLRALWAEAAGIHGPSVASATRRLEAKTAFACGRVTTPFERLFQLHCVDVTTPDALAACAVRMARMELYRGRAGAYGLTIPCDLTDNGTADLSCPSPELAAHVLNRLGYGPDSYTRKRLKTLGVRGYIAEQLHPETIPNDEFEDMLRRFPSLGMNFLELRIHYPNRVVPGQPQSGDVLKELQNAKVLRAIASHRQLEQVLVDFWFNHFNIVATDRRDYDISPYERIAIRPYVFGRFRDLLLAVARSPGMGDYLDGRRNKVDGLNENFAREVMELHTIGADGGFAEADVNDVARAFTGWREDQSAVDGFEFFPAWHDLGPKQVLGLALPANGGYEDGLAVIDLLAAHPATAARIARKLVIRFVSERPPQRLVEAAAATFLATGGDLRAVMETILLSPEFLEEPANRGAKVKRPLHLMASLARAVHADPATLNLDRIRRRIRELGEDLYGFPAPSGFPDVSAAWTSPGTMLLRFNVIELATRGVDGIVPALPASDGTATGIVDAFGADFFPGGVSASTRDTAIAFLDVLGSSGDPGRRAAAAAVLLSSPEFLVH